MALLEGKKILVTGLLTEASIAFQVARLAQQEGAEVVLTSFGRQLPGRDRRDRARRWRRARHGHVAAHITDRSPTNTPVP